MDPIRPHWPGALRNNAGHQIVILEQRSFAGSDGRSGVGTRAGMAIAQIVPAGTIDWCGSVGIYDRTCVHFLIPWQSLARTRATWLRWITTGTGRLSANRSLESGCWVGLADASGGSVSQGGA